VIFESPPLRGAILFWANGHLTFGFQIRLEIT
jgi:hypothetical protein